MNSSCSGSSSESRGLTSSKGISPRVSIGNLGTYQLIGSTLVYSSNNAFSGSFQNLNINLDNTTQNLEGSPTCNYQLHNFSYIHKSKFIKLSDDSRLYLHIEVESHFTFIIHRNGKVFSCDIPLSGYFRMSFSKYLSMKGLNSEIDLKVRCIHLLSIEGLGFFRVLSESIFTPLDFTRIGSTIPMGKRRRHPQVLDAFNPSKASDRSTYVNRKRLMYQLALKLVTFSITQLDSVNPVAINLDLFAINSQGYRSNLYDVSGSRFTFSDVVKAFISYTDEPELMISKKLFFKSMGPSYRYNYFTKG